MLAIVAAMESEVNGVLRARGWSRDAAPGLLAWRRDLAPSGTLLVVSGVGREAATAVAQRLMAQSRPTAVLSIGFAGALSPELRPGDLLVAGQVRAWSSTLGAGAPFRSDPELVGLAEAAVHRHGLTLLSGDWLTVESAVCSVEEKRRLWQRTEAVAVEMESYWLAEAAHRAGVPFLAVRAVLDDALADVPKFVLEAAEEAPLRVLGRAVRHPGSIPALFGLGRAMVKARRSVTRFVVALMEEFARRPLASAASGR